MNQEIIQKVISGKASESEMQQFLQWLENDGQMWLDAFIEKQWNLPPATSSGEEKEVFIRAVLDRLRDDTYSFTERRRIPSYKRVYQLLSAVAAACVIVIVGWWVTGRSSDKKSSLPLVHTIRNTERGKPKKVALPDGTTVTLNGQSTLTYADDYNSKTRKVMLDGEAFFEVAHDSVKPFMVQTARLTTKVYGTAFDVYAYSGSTEYRVALQRGRVSFLDSIDHHELFLNPGQLLIYTKNNHDLKVNEMPVAEMGEWLNGRLIFYRTPVQDVFDQLAVQYGVHFIQEKPISDKLLNASFDHAPLDKVLKRLSYLWGFHYTKSADTIRIL
jgi:transmembrane sensor